MNPMLAYRKSLMRTDYVAQGEEEPAANPFDAICKDSKRPQGVGRVARAGRGGRGARSDGSRPAELPAGTCSTWTPDTLAGCAAGDREPRSCSSKERKPKR